ncbi:MAG: hypothetical protein JWM16_543 [Verrucomicrobiales bacterium]|nr:hypothetical protein [Verrucomicrobiales bacterium]
MSKFKRISQGLLTTLLWATPVGTVCLAVTVFVSTYLNHHPPQIPSGKQLEPRVLQFRVLGSDVSIPCGYTLTQAGSKSDSVAGTLACAAFLDTCQGFGRANRASRGS